MDELEISGKRYISTRRAGKDHKYHSDYIGQLIRAKKVVGQKVGRSWYVDAESLEAYLGAETSTGNTSAPVARIVTKPTPAPVEKIVEAVPEVQEEVVPEVSEEVVEENIQEEVEAAQPAEEITDNEESYIPIKISQQEEEKKVTPIYRTTKEAREAGRGLRYIADEGPLLPPIKKHHVMLRKESAPIAHTTQADTWPVPVRIAQLPMVVAERSREEVIEKRLHTAPAVKHRSFKRSRAALFVMRTGMILAIGAIVFSVAALAATHLLFTLTVSGEQSAHAGYGLQ